MNTNELLVKKFKNNIVYLVQSENCFDRLFKSYSEAIEHVLKFNIWFQCDELDLNTDPNNEDYYETKSEDITNNILKEHDIYQNTGTGFYSNLNNYSIIPVFIDKSKPIYVSYNGNYFFTEITQDKQKWINKMDKYYKGKSYYTEDFKKDFIYHFE